MRRQRNENRDVSQCAFISLPVYTEFESVQNTNAAKTKNGKGQTGISRVPHPSFSWSVHFSEQTASGSLSSQFYLV